MINEAVEKYKSYLNINKDESLEEEKIKLDSIKSTVRKEMRDVAAERMIADKRAAYAAAEVIKANDILKEALEKAKIAKL